MNATGKGTPRRGHIGIPKPPVDRQLCPAALVVNVDAGLGHVVE